MMAAMFVILLAICILAVLFVVVAYWSSIISSGVAAGAFTLLFVVSTLLMYSTIVFNSG